MRRRVVVRLASSAFLLCCILTTSLARSQMPPLATDNNSNAKFSISGTVINSVTNEPIRRALVQIYSGGQRLAMTDGNGQFEFDNLPPGQSVIDVRKPGFFDRGQLPDSSEISNMVNVGPDAKPVLVKLLPEGIIYGHAQSVDGEPLEDLTVKLLTARIVDGRKRWQQAGMAATNEDGEFRIAGLLPGDYYLEAGPVSPRRQIDVAGQDPPGYPAVFYPNAPDLAAATAIQVSPGQQVNAELALHKVRFFKVSGVLDTGRADSGVSIQITDAMGNDVSRLNRFDSSSGNFEVLVPSGEYTLKASTWPAGKPSEATMPLNVSSDISGVKLVPAPAYSIPVQIRTESTHSTAHSAQAGVPIPRLELISTNPLSPALYGIAVEGNPKNPSITLRSLPAGKYSVELNIDSPWYVQSAHCGDIDLLRGEITVPAGVQMPPIEITLRDDSASLDLQTEPATTRRRVLTVLVPDNGSAVRATTSIASGNNAIEVPGLAPGGYSLLALDGANEIEFRNPDVLVRYLAGAVHVVFQPDQHQQVTIQLTKLKE